MYSLIKGESSNIYHDEIIQDILELRDMSELSKFYENEDDIFIFGLLQELKQELGFVRLEGVVYCKFLEKYDPTLFAKVLKAPIKKSKVSFGAFSRSSKSDSRHSRMSFLDSKNLSDAEFDTGSKENRMNISVKKELTEKLTFEIEQKLKEDRVAGTKLLKNHKALVALHNLDIEDLEGTIRSFENIVVDGGQIEHPTAVKISAERFTRYCFNWMKNAQAFISTIRVKISSVQQQAHVQRTTLVKKLDMREFVMPVDILKIQITRDLYEKEVEEQNMQKIGLEKKQASTSLAVALQKQGLVETEKKIRDVKRNIVVTQNEVDKVRQEIYAMENEVIASNERFTQFNNQIDAFEAPTIHDYMNLKEKLSLIEREEKMIQRENHVLKMKLDNYKAKLTKRERLRSSQME